MTELSVTGLLETFLKTNPSITLPQPWRICTITDRIRDIQRIVQRQEISKLNPLPILPESLKNQQEFSTEPPTAEEKAHAAAVEAWWDRNEQLLWMGIGRQPLVRVVPEHSSPETIVRKLREEYRKSPKDAGITAQRLLSFTPFLEYFGVYPHECGVQEECETAPIPGTSQVLKFQYDCLSLEYVNEFKLTTDYNKESQLLKGLVQLYLYDFCFRLKWIQTHDFRAAFRLPLFLDICVLDKEMIYIYGGFDPPNQIVVDKEVLKRVFEASEVPELGRIYEEIHALCSGLRPFSQKDALMFHEDNRTRFGP